MANLELYHDNPAFTVVTGVCPHDCPDTCSWQVAVEKGSGQAVALAGHPLHPITRGSLCGKVDRYLERTYHAGRLLTPLRRCGPKGSGQFEPVSWSSALDTIARRLQETIDGDGPEAVLPFSYSGTLGFLQGEGMASRFFHRLGASQLARTICSEAGFEGYLYTIGAAEGMLPEEFAHARLILIWGSNTLTSNLHLWPFVQQARRQGARVLTIDPANTRTAQASDEWIALHPGTDGALALAMMHVLVDENRCDADYIARYTLGFDRLVERVRDWTPERAASITGIPAQRIVDLARDYALAQPAAIRINYGLQRHYGGGMAVRTIACLPALVGAWRQRGGGIQLSSSGLFRHLDHRGLHRPDLLSGRTPRTFNMNRLGDALSLDPGQRARALYRARPVDPLPTVEQAGPPVKALVVYNCNPAAVVPDQNAVLAGLRRPDLFTVVLEQFQTDTADYADFVLPATTQLEHWDIHRSYGHGYLALNRPAIAPVGAALPNSEIFRRLAAALHYTDPCFTETDEEILRAWVAAQKHPRFANLGWEQLSATGFYRVEVPAPYLPFAEGNFPTPSGKCEFFSARMADDGYDPLPTYTPPRWQQSAVQTDNPPLVCISPPAHSFLNSSFANVPRLLRREKQPTLQIHPDDAARRGIGDGDPVSVSNLQGSVCLIAQVTDHLIAGTVLAPGLWWPKLSPDQRNINQVTPADETDMGAGACFYDVSVWVARQEEPEGGA